MRALALNHFAGTFGFALSFPFLSVYCHKILGVSITETGIAFGILGLVRALSQYLGGELADRGSVVRLMSISLFTRSFLFALVALGIYFRIGFYPIILLSFFQTVAGSVHQMASQNAVSILLPDEQKMHGFAVTRAASNIGFAAGPAAGGWLVGYSYVIPFTLTAVLLLVSIVPLMSLNVRGRTAIARTSGEKETLPMSFIVYLFAVFLVASVMAQIITPMSLYLVGMKGIGESNLGWLYALNGLIVGLLQVKMMHVFRAISYLRVMIIGSITYFVGYAALGMQDGLPWYVFTTMLITLGEMLVAPPSVAHAERIAPTHRTGRYLGLVGFSAALGWAFGPTYGSWLLEQTDNSTLAWCIIALPALMSAAIMMILDKKTNIART
ncbi:MAG: MFS transporter [Leptospirales bacterium]|nr:MFS transporter [Leptospirales bacterium]